MNHRLVNLMIVGWLPCWAALPAAADWTSFTGESTPALEKRLAEIDQELGRLAHPRLVSGIGPIGYRSKPHAGPDQTEWIEVDLEEPATVNAVILVPALFHRPDSSLEADGFPEAFRVLAFQDGSDREIVLAEFSAADGLLPRKAPVVIECPPTVASRIRLEATRLGVRAWDGLHCLQLAELFVFSGEDNLALGQPVNCSSSDDDPEAARDASFVVDGFVPFLMDAQGGEQSIAFMTHLRQPDPCSITIDLEQNQRLDGLRLHAADVSDNVPQSHANSFGIPRHLRIESAETAEFATPILLTDYRITSSLTEGPVVTLRIPPTNCRFIRLTSIVPSLSDNSERPFFGFAEVECLVEGRNVAVGRPVTTDLPMEELSRPDRLPAITDGSNYYGRILPVRHWLEQLARRHDLESERPIVREKLNAAYRRQSQVIQRLLWLSLLLAAVLVAVIAVGWSIRQRAILRTREQIAADLHDELGANLHAIGLYGDLAKAAADNPAKLAGLLDRMRELTARSGNAAKSCVNLLESVGLYKGLASDLRRTSARLLADLDYSLEIDGEEHLEQLPPKLQIGVALFYKECLTNIIRHSGATHVATKLQGTAGELVLTVADNGCGLAEQPATNRGAPASLARRARLLGGMVVAAELADGGTSVTLRTRTRTRWLSL